MIKWYNIPCMSYDKINEKMNATVYFSMDGKYVISVARRKFYTRALYSAYINTGTSHQMIGMYPTMREAKEGVEQWQKNGLSGQLPESQENADSKSYPPILEDGTSSLSLNQAQEK